MTKRQRTVLWMLAVFVICAGLIIVTAYSVGADPFHPRSRGTWLLSLLAAAYVSFRSVRIVTRLVNRKGHQGASSWWRPFATKEHAIDRRMAERKARVEAAKSKAAEQGDKDA